MHTMPSMAIADSAELHGLKQSLEKELTQLKARIEHVERTVAAMQASEMLQEARRNHADPNWFAQLREQYSEEVSKRTLELNDAFPIAEE